MPKRKREDLGPASAARDASDPRPSAQNVRAGRIVERGYETLAKAFKLAKGFERQKLSRRHKTAKTQKNQKDVERIDAEIEALKILNADLAAANYLAKTLLKIKSIASSPHLPDNVTKEIRQTSDTASLNVIARLCKSNPVRDALPQIINDVQTALGVDSSVKSKQAAQKGPENPTPSVKESQDSDGDVDGDEDEFKGFSTGDEECEIGSEIDDDALAAFDERLASGSDEDEDNEPRPKVDIRSLLNVYGSESEADSDPEADLSDPEPFKGVPRRRESRSESPSRSPSPSPPPAPAQRHSTSAFIPSLTSGYISGGSDSDPEAEFDDLIGGADGRPKKNRRGQRARQAIWEKKYGEGAKHVVEGKETGRDEGWDAKRGATDGRGRGRGGRGGMRGGFGGAGRRSAPVPAEIKHRDDDGKLHPSWEAAKRRKDASQGGEPVKFAGKKIFFD